MAYMYIPVQNPEEKVKVALDQLPRDASDILDILKAEQAPLKSMASHRGSLFSFLFPFGSICICGQLLIWIFIIGKT